MGKIVASCFSVFAISFFALPAGILGSGFALKVQQKQRQKHFNRQIPAAATLIQCLWRCHAAEQKSTFRATWRIHEQDSACGHGSHHLTRPFGRLTRRSGGGSVTSTSRKAAVRQPSKNSLLDGGGNISNCGLGSTDVSCHGGMNAAAAAGDSHDVDESTVFLQDSRGFDASPNDVNLSNRSSCRPSRFIDPTANDTEAEPEAPTKPVQLTDAHKSAIRVIRRIRYFVARRKFQQARKPYDVRDVIEQYSQGHLNMMVRIKELQRRLDQTLGKPGSWMVSSEREKQRMTIISRLSRVELQVNKMDTKMDRMLTLLNQLVQQQLSTAAPAALPVATAVATTAHHDNGADNDTTDRQQLQSNGTPSSPS